jgi:hypothetical protein
MDDVTKEWMKHHSPTEIVMSNSEMAMADGQSRRRRCE